MLNILKMNPDGRGILHDTETDKRFTVRVERPDRIAVLLDRKARRFRDTTTVSEAIHMYQDAVAKGDSLTWEAWQTWLEANAYKH